MVKIRLKSSLHIDSEKIRLQKDTADIIDGGTLDQFKRALYLAGIDPESVKGRALIDRWISLGSGGR
jgi:hypothetical protein